MTTVKKPESIFILLTTISTAMCWNISNCEKEEYSEYYGLLNIKCMDVDSIEFDHVSKEFQTPIGIITYTGNIKEIAPDDFQTRTALRELRVINSNLQIISPNPFRYLEFLTTLDLSGNNLTYLEQDTFRWLGPLENLILSGNPLTELPNRIFDNFMSLRSLDLSDTELTNLNTNWLYNLRYLMYLKLSGTNINAIRQKSFGFYNNIRILDLSKSKSLTKLVNDSFSGLTFLLELTLEDSNIAEMEADSFVGLPALTTLNLSKNNLTKLVKKGFNGLKSLSVLNLKESNIEEITENAFQGLQQLKELDLSHNKLLNLVPFAFSDLSKLFILNLSYNSITNIDPRDLEAIPILSGTLDLTGNRVNLKNKSLQGAEALNTLILSNNSMKTIPIGTFSNMTFLRTLNISKNNIRLDDFGTFSGLSRLRSIDLSYNNLTYLGKHVLQPLKILETIILDGNIGVENNMSFIEVVSSTLRTVSFGSNFKDCNFVSDLSYFLKKRGMQMISTYEKTEFENHVDNVGCLVKKN